MRIKKNHIIEVMQLAISSYEEFHIWNLKAVIRNDLNGIAWRTTDANVQHINISNCFIHFVSDDDNDNDNSVWFFYFFYYFFIHS